MTRAIEDELSAAMRQQVIGLTPAADIVARTVRRHRRGIRIRLGVAVTGSAGITATAVAVSLPGTLSRAGSPGSGAAGPGATAPRRTSPAVQAGGSLPSSPRARLLAAMTRSAQLSYRLHVLNLSVLPSHKTTLTSPPRDLIAWYADYTGVYDPRTRSGSGVSILRNESGGLGNPARFGKPGGYDQVRSIGNKYYDRFSYTPRFRAGSSWTAGAGSIA